MITSVILGAIAMSFAWGVRGTVAGAMRGATFAGAVLGLTIAAVSGIPEIREAWLFLTAAGAVGIGYGGCMTYGQTLGLTQDGDPPTAYWWGLLGTAVKGTVWIGLGTILMAMVVSPVVYGFGEWIALAAGGTVAWSLGIKLLNRPMDPPHRFPVIYFSDRSDTGRLEYWGGMWGLFLFLLVYAGIVKGDSFAAGMAGFGLLGGLGFPIGQIPHSWGSRKAPFGRDIQRHIDWWKVMELAFGAVAGVVVIFGWLWMEKSLTGQVPVIGSGVENAFFSLNPVDAHPIMWVLALLYAVGVATEQRWKPKRSPLGTWWTLLYIHTLPFILLAAGSGLWAALVAGPLVFWVVGITVPGRKFPSKALSTFATVVVALGIVGTAALALTDRLTPATLWYLVIVYHLILTYLAYLSERRGKIRGLLHPVSIIFTVMTIVLVVWPVW